METHIMRSLIVETVLVTTVI